MNIYKQWLRAIIIAILPIISFLCLNILNNIFDPANARDIYTAYSFSILQAIVTGVSICYVVQSKSFSTPAFNKIAYLIPTIYLVLALIVYIIIPPIFRNLRISELFIIFIPYLWRSIQMFANKGGKTITNNKQEINS